MTSAPTPAAGPLQKGASEKNDAVPAPKAAPPGRRRFVMPWNDLVVTAAAFVLALVVGALLMIVSDSDVRGKYAYFFARPGDALGASWTKVWTAYSALFSGAVGGWGAFTNSTAQAAPLIVAGLGIGVAFRAGLFNIGAQGQAIWGSVLAAWVGFNFHSLPLVVHLPLAVLAGLVGGFVWGGIAGLLKARAGAHEVIVTIMMNYIAAGLLAWLLTTSPFMRPGRTDPIAPVVDWNATFPRLANSQLHLGFFLALVAGAAVWWLMERTTLGFRIKAVGANPRAAATAGMSVSNITMVTMGISGLLAGLAGVEAALGPLSGATPTPLTQGLVGSVGFDAITVALLGRSRPLGIVLAGLLFGALHAGGITMQADAATPVTLTTVLQALIVLFVAAPKLVRTILPFLKTRRRRSTPVTPKNPATGEPEAAAGAIAPSQGGLA